MGRTAMPVSEGEKRLSRGRDQAPLSARPFYAEAVADDLGGDKGLQL